MLNTVSYGDDATLPPILIAHGLFGSARNWNVIAKRLSETRRVLAVDMRNHGESPWFDSHTYSDMAGDLAEVIAAHGGVADVVGHSMGGKAAMVLALEHTEAVRKLIVADIAPVAYGHTQSHLIDAMETVDLGALKTRRDADALLAKAVPEAGTRAFLLQSLDVAGRRWRLNHAVLRREMPSIIGFPEIEGSAEMSALFLSGAASDYVLPEHRADIKALFPNARFAKIPEAGHWLHADKPREFEASVAAFFSVD